MRKRQVRFSKQDHAPQQQSNSNSPRASPNVAKHSEPKRISTFSIVIGAIAIAFVGLQAFNGQLSNWAAKKPSNAPKTTHDPTAEYSYDDFESKFDTHPLHYVIFDPAMEKALEGIDIRNDWVYKQDPEEMDKLSALYGPVIEAGSSEKRDREIAAIKYSSPAVGYGLFAKK